VSGQSAGDRQPWWASVGDDVPTDSGVPSDDSATDSSEPHVHGGSGPECQVCPICAFLRVVDQARPEVVGHLVEAARQLTLAAKAALDAHASSFPPPAGGFEHIDVEG